MFLFADSARLTQALMNLLNNAAKYTDAGGRIELDCGLEGDHAIDSRARTTASASKPRRSRRYSTCSFRSIPRSRRAQGGLGIGLSLVKSVVELHGGTVEARSAGLGHGSEFMLRVPAQQSARNASRFGSGF